MASRREAAARYPHLVWTAAFPHRLSAIAIGLIEDQSNDLVFSAVSIWEVAIKRGLERHDLRLEPSSLRRQLLENGYEEMPITSAHAVTAGTLPTLHKDPFDRMLVAQAIVEDTVLLTSDAQLVRYPGPVRLV